MTKPKPKTTKAALLRGLLGTEAGATLAEICKTTGWQAHSARAAISVLRKSGTEVERITGEMPDRKSRYRLAGPAGELA